MDHMRVLLSSKPASPIWGSSTDLSFEHNGAVIHLRGDAKAQLRCAQLAGRQLASQGIEALRLEGMGWDLDLCWSFYLGYFSPKTLPNIELPFLSESDVMEFRLRQQTIDWARRLINQSPENCFPLSLCQQSADLLKQLAPEHITFELLMGDELDAAGYPGVYQVGRGSDRPPVMLILDYNPTSDEDAPVAAALVGKGITYDSGGYSLKSSEMMKVMKSDMGGAATVTAALALAIGRGLTKRVKLFLCCAENLVSGYAYKLGDVITYQNGVSVEVLNTDAEGRLVLADGLIAASETQAPLIIDAATLTGAAKVALGRDYNALFGYDHELVQQALSFARAEQEMAWSLPLDTWHQEALSSPFADMANVSSGEGGAGASIAAAFLSRFVKEPQQGWLHIDLSGAYQKSADTLWSAGGKGHGVRTIARLLTELA
jgi:PepB aminopeptidase